MDSNPSRPLGGRLPRPEVLMKLMLSPLAFIALVIGAPPASGVDFKIDLPPNLGAAPGRARAADLDIPDFPDNISDDQMASGGDGSPPLPPQQAIQRWEKHSQNTQNAASDFRSFPMPACLVDNVDFWVSVYRDVTPSGVIFHDREDLGRVYGVANLPNSAALRRNASELYKSYFSGKLRELADRIHRPGEWDSAHRDLARLFKGTELNAERVRRAADNIRLQSGLKGRFEEGIQRSLAFLPTVQRILNEEGLPAEIALLPHVESSYHPRAVSKVGAVGLWQIMPDTMRMLLGQSFVARRTEVEPATRAAAKLLRQNYQATKSWPLALTAYNHGLNGVMKAVRKTGSRDICTIIERYDSASFRFASSNFYAQFLAARRVAVGRYAELARTSEAGRVLRPLLAKTGTTGL